MVNFWILQLSLSQCGVRLIRINLSLSLSLSLSLFFISKMLIRYFLMEPGSKISYLGLLPHCVTFNTSNMSNLPLINNTQFE